MQNIAISPITTVWEEYRNMLIFFKNSRKNKNKPYYTNALVISLLDSQIRKAEEEPTREQLKRIRKRVVLSDGRQPVKNKEYILTPGHWIKQTRR